MRDLVSVVIVTRGIKDYFLVCLESVFRQTYIPLEVTLIDNSMAPSVAAQVFAAYPSVRIVSTGRNLYYCEALNRGISKSRGTYVLCLNDDVRLEPSFLSEALRGFDASSRIGMVTGKLLRPDRVTIDSAGMSLTVWRTPKERGYGEQDRGQLDINGPVFAANCAAALFRRSMLDDIREGEDWFDPDFRIFFEDLDICWRARRRGWGVYYVPQAVAYHVRGGTVRQDSGEGRPLARQYLSDYMNALLLRNRYLVLIKNEKLWRLLFCSFPLLGYELLAWAYVLIYRPLVIKIFWSERSCFLRAWRKRLSWQSGCRPGQG